MELISGILYELALIGHKEALLASLVVRKMAAEFLQISFDHRIIHWSKLVHFNQTMGPASERKPLHFNSLAISLHFKKAEVNSSKDQDSLVNYLKFQEKCSLSSNRERLYRVIDLVKLDLDVAHLTLFGYYSTGIFRAVSFDWDTFHKIKHLTLINTGTSQEIKDMAIQYRHHRATRTTFSNCTSLWIDEPDKYFPSHKSGRRRRCYLHFPVMSYIYLAFQRGEITISDEVRVDQIFEALYKFAELFAIPSKVWIAVLVFFEEDFPDDKITPFMEHLQMKVHWEGRARYVYFNYNHLLEMNYWLQYRDYKGPPYSKKSPNEGDDDDARANYPSHVERGPGWNFWWTKRTLLITMTETPPDLWVGQLLIQCLVLILNIIPSDTTLDARKRIRHALEKVWKTEERVVELSEQGVSSSESNSGSSSSSASDSESSFDSQKGLELETDSDSMEPDIWDQARYLEVVQFGIHLSEFTVRKIDLPGIKFPILRVWKVCSCFFLLYHLDALWFSYEKEDGPTQTSSTAEELHSPLPVELVHNILYQLAHQGHNVAVLAALILRDLSSKILEISYNHRVIHWTQLVRFERMMIYKLTGQPPPFDSLSVCLTMNLNDYNSKSTEKSNDGTLAVKHVTFTETETLQELQKMHFQSQCEHAPRTTCNSYQTIWIDHPDICSFRQSFSCHLYFPTLKFVST